jgi:hypothetical protein
MVSRSAGSRTARSPRVVSTSTRSRC